MGFGSVRLVLALIACHLCHVQGASRDVFTLCNGDIEPVNRTAFDINFGGINSVISTGSGQQQCTCELMTFTHTYLDVILDLPDTEDTFNGDGEEDFSRPSSGSSGQGSARNATCNPFVIVSGTDRSTLTKCSAPKSENASRMTLSIPAGNAVHVTLHNHKRLQVEPNFKFTVLSGSLGVMCHAESQSLVWSSSVCPCAALTMTPGGNNGPGVDRPRGTSTSQTGVIVGIVCVVIFLIIVAAVLLFLWWRKRSAGGQKDLEVVDPGNVASENPAFTSSRGSGLDRSAGHPEPQTGGGPIYSNVGPPTQKIPFDPDPSLNLDMQTAPPKGKGSTDSGVYTMPGEKGGMTNNNGRYANTPIAPDQMYNPMLNAKQPSTASLTGQGALHGSMDQLDPSALYAKPNKGPRNPVNPNPAPTRSASHDALNQRPQEGDLQQARSRSHNTSMASMGSAVETDV